MTALTVYVRSDKTTEDAATLDILRITAKYVGWHELLSFAYNCVIFKKMPKNLTTLPMQHVQQRCRYCYYILLYYIWYDIILYDIIWYDMIWYDMIWYDIILYYIILYYINQPCTYASLSLVSPIILHRTTGLIFTSLLTLNISPLKLLCCIHDHIINATGSRKISCLPSRSI